jgi:type IV pilus assembly protein PilW
MRNSVSRGMAGVSLIELMVALAVGSLLVLGLVQVFAASRAASITAEGIGRVQENGRFAIDFLQRDIRMIGHFGCVNDQGHWVKGVGDVVNHLGTSNVALNFDVSVTGYEATNTAPGQTVNLGAPAAGWTPALPAQIAALSPRAGSDIISLRFLADEGLPALSLAPAAAQTAITVPAGRTAALTSDGVTNPSLFGVADCSGADVFRGAITANTIQSSGLPAGAEFSARFTGVSSGGNTQLFRAESLVYYVGTSVSGEPALFRARANGAGAYVAEELVEGVESLQFIYGRDATPVIDTANPPLGNITFQDPASTLGVSAAEWRRVGLVQVGVLARSPSPAAAEAPATAEARPRVLGVQFNPPAAADSRYRSSYEVTVALRNRLFGN